MNRLLLDSCRHLCLDHEGGRLLGKANIERVGRECRRYERAALVPNELDEFVFQVASDGNDLVEVVSPSDEDTLIALADDDTRELIRQA